MSFVTNTAAQKALNWNRQIARSGSNAVERLSSGLRINKGADDPSGLGISSGMKARIRGMRQAAGNIQDGIKLINTMDAGLAEIQDMLMRMKELAVRAANEATLTLSDRQKLQNESDALREAIDQVSDSTKYNTKDLLYVNGDYQKSSNRITIANTSYISLSGDGSTIAYTKWDGSFDLYVANADGTNAKRITNSSDVEMIGRDSVSNDGTRVIYSSNGNLMSYNTTDGQITYLDNNYQWYTFSGNGEKVVFEQNNDIFMIDFDGNNKTQLTFTPFVIEQDISVDDTGKRIAYSDGFAHVIDLASKVNYQINGVLTSGTSLSRDGERIYFHETANGFVGAKYNGTEVKNIRSLTGISGVYGLAGNYLTYVYNQNIYILNVEDGEVNKATINALPLVLDVESSGNGNTVAYSDWTFVGFPSSHVIFADVTDEQMLQVGPDNQSDNRVSVVLEDMGSGSLGVWGVTLTRTDGAWAAIGKIDAAIEKVSAKRAEIGTVSKRLEHTLDDMMAQSLGTENGRSTIEDADMAQETTEMVKAQLQEQSNLRAATLAHDLPRSVLNLLDEQLGANAA